MDLEERIASILRSAGVQFKIRNQSFIIDCPECGKKDKVWINKKAGFFICWHCADAGAPNGKGGKAEYALHTLTKIPIGDLRTRLYGFDESKLQGFDFDASLDPAPTETEIETTVNISDDYRSILDPESKEGMDYLLFRGIPTGIAKEYGLMFSTVARRILFPAYVLGELVGYQARTIDPITEKNKVKAYSSRGNWRGQYVMFHDRMIGHDCVILSEGPIDAIKAHLVGGNVASLGKHVTLQQLECIRDSGATKLYIALDKDALEGVPEIARQAEMETFLVRTPEGRDDLGDSTPQEVLKAFEDAEPVTGRDLFLDFD